MPRRQKLSPQKTDLGQKNCQLDKKTFKNSYLYALICQNPFSQSQSHSVNAAHDKKNMSLSEKISSQGTHFTVES